MNDEQIENLLSDDVLSKDKARLDNMVKKLLAQKVILARILKRVVRECADMSLDMIIQCIEGEPEISSRPVNPGKTNSEITGNREEDSVRGEGTICYDIIFDIKLPKNGKQVKFIINIEAQKDYYPGYHISTRMVFYLARQISAQKNREFSKSDYDGIKKCYSIWLCMDAPDYIGNAISSFRMKKDDILPGIPDERDTYDKMEGIMIALNEKYVTEDELLGMMNTLLSEKLKLEEKKSCLQNKYGMKICGEVERRIDMMCNYSDLVEERGIEKGIEKGISSEKYDTVKRMTRLGLDTGVIAQSTGLTVEEVGRVQRKMLVEA